MTPDLIKTHCELDSDSTALLRQAFLRFKYSARTYHKFLKLARTFADMENAKVLIDCCENNDTFMISSLNPLYPPILHQYPKAPTLLYVRGDLNPLAFVDTAAIVGPEDALANYLIAYNAKALTTTQLLRQSLNFLASPLFP